MKILFKRKPTPADEARSEETPAPSAHREGDNPYGAKNVTITIRGEDGRPITLKITDTDYIEYDDYSWRGR